jgi:hypothetical protein
MPGKPVPSTTDTAESRAESRRVLLAGLAGLTKIVEDITLGHPEPLPPTQTCRMALL